MRIESIDIQNVMRFERFEATFSSFNVIIGDNGAGRRPSSPCCAGC
ncbi:MAG: hypothetical protein IPG17_29390 [Sandaracinaceae bacterium]|nr:hypothetical protein [Sandaracinaceae bacterium]